MEEKTVNESNRNSEDLKDKLKILSKDLNNDIIKISDPKGKQLAKKTKSIIDNMLNSFLE